MLTISQIVEIRELYYKKGMNLAQIASQLNCDWRTVRKYVDMEDFSPKSPVPRRPSPSKLDPYKARINEILREEMLFTHNKRQNSVKKLYERLQEEFPAFDCSYRLVALYVRETKARILAQYSQKELERLYGYEPKKPRDLDSEEDL